MTDEQFYACYCEVKNYTDRDAFVSDMALSSIWGDDPESEIPESRIEELVAVWDAIHRPMPEIIKMSGLSARAFARKFCVPYRTIENWSSGDRTPPDHERIMMQRLLNLI